MPQVKLSAVSVIIVVGVLIGSLGYFIGTQLVFGPPPPAAAAAAPGPGVTYNPPLALPDFTLDDQTGRPYSLTSSRGKVVLMAFLFTHCGDVCPFSAVKMRLAWELLGDAGRNVDLVVVGTDPERDTVPVLAAYSRDLGLYDKWHYLTGPLPVMTKLWKDLKITVVKSAEEEAEAPTKNAADLGTSLPQKDQTDSPLYGLTDAQVLEGGKIAQKYMGGYQIAHAAPFWIVDGQGQLRTSLDVSASPAQVAAAIRTLLAKS